MHPRSPEADSEFEDCELLGQGAYGMVHKVQDKASWDTDIFIEQKVTVASHRLRQATGQSKVLKSVVRPEGWDDERLKLEACRFFYFQIF